MKKKSAKDRGNREVGNESIPYYRPENVQLNGVHRDDLVFCTRDGTPMEPNNMIHREFLPALVRAGLRRIRFHDLRHTYATLLVAQGENVKFIQSQLGHGSVQTTLDRYGHLLPSMAHGVGQRLDAQVFTESSRANTVLTKQAESGSNGENQQAALAHPTLSERNH